MNTERTGGHTIVSPADVLRFVSKLRIEQSILADTPCWIWMGKPGWHGYGSLHIRGEGKTRKWWAHRLAWRIFRGEEIPPGMEIHHNKCRNYLCCNPDHMELLNAVEHARESSHYRDDSPHDDGDVPF